MAVAGALSGFLRNLKLGEWGLARWALHDSCPIDAQENQRGSGCGGDEPQDEGDKNVHASLLNSIAHTQGFASQLPGPLISVQSDA